MPPLLYTATNTNNVIDCTAEGEIVYLIGPIHALLPLVVPDKQNYFYIHVNNS